MGEYLPAYSIQLKKTSFIGTIEYQNQDFLYKYTNKAAKYKKVIEIQRE